MNIGDKVEVNQIWASNGHTKPPSTHWFKGYTVHAILKPVGWNEREQIIQVKIEHGVFAGCVVNYAKKDVRYDR